MSAEKMVKGVIEGTRDWPFEVVTIGFPGPVRDNKIVRDPVNLGTGWAGFDFTAAFGRPVKLLNDAAMQAVGAYRSGRMLFLGLGTGLGTTLIIDYIVHGMELGHLPYKNKRSFEEVVGNRGLQRIGKKRWRKAVHDVVAILTDGLQPDEVVLGGGNAKKLEELPPGIRRVDNTMAFVGGCRLWQDERFRT